MIPIIVASLMLLVVSVRERTVIESPHAVTKPAPKPQVVLPRDKPIRMVQPLRPAPRVRKSIDIDEYQRTMVPPNIFVVEVRDYPIPLNEVKY